VGVGGGRSTAKKPGFLWAKGAEERPGLRGARGPFGPQGVWAVRSGKQTREKKILGRFELAGKWHLGIQRPGPPQAGFQTQV